MRVFLAGLFGAAASAAAWLAAEHFTQSSYGWMVCLVGLVTGFCVLKARTGNTGGVARGALAIILTLSAILGGRWVYARVMEASAKDTSAAVAVNIDPAGDAADEDSDTDDAVATTPAAIAIPEIDPSAELAGGYSKSAMKKSGTEWDMIWMCVAALAAYVTGRGGDGKAPTVVVEEESHAAAEEPDGSSEDESGENA